MEGLGARDCSKKRHTERVGKGRSVKNGEEKMKVNHLMNGWEGWLMDSRSVVSGPISCQKCFGLAAKGNLGETSLLKILESFLQKPSFVFLLF